MEEIRLTTWDVKNLVDNGMNGIIWCLIPAACIFRTNLETPWPWVRCVLFGFRSQRLQSRRTQWHPMLCSVNCTNVTDARRQTTPEKCRIYILYGSIRLDDANFIISKERSKGKRTWVQVSCRFQLRLSGQNEHVGSRFGICDRWLDPFHCVFFSGFGGIFACDSVAALRKTCHCQA